jgi:DNA (cytosine-5)-methyltransferase 1
VAIHTTYISLYTGSGMLDEGFRQGLVSLGLSEPKPVCYVERDFEAGALLVDKILSGKLDEAPIWTDSGTIDCKPFVGKVDAIVGGFPCQPWSVAGKKRGKTDERWLWDHIKRITVEVRPRFLFLENVPGLLVGGGLHTILGDFAEIGYDAEWISLPAAEVGASHKRERIFILAHTKSKGQVRITDIQHNKDGERQIRKDIRDNRHEIRCYTGRGCSELAHANGKGPQGHRSQYELPKDSRQSEISGSSNDVAHTESRQSRKQEKRNRGEDSKRRSTELDDSKHNGHVTSEVSRDIGQGSYNDKERSQDTSQSERPSERIPQTGNMGNHGERPTFAPRPNNPIWDDIIKYRGDLAPATAKTSESEIRGMVNGVARKLDTISRTGILRYLGNGVVPQQAATALAILYERIANETVLPR